MCPMGGPRQSSLEDNSHFCTLEIYALLVNRNLPYGLGGLASKKAENCSCSKQMITRQGGEP